MKTKTTTPELDGRAFAQNKLDAAVAAVRANPTNNEALCNLAVAIGVWKGSGLGAVPADVSALLKV